MKVAALTGLRRVQVREASRPRLKNDTDLLIRVGAVGLCGSDIHYFREGRIGDQVVAYPFIVGHECAGTVVETAPAVRSLKPGDRVAIDPAIVCGVCDQCLAERPNTCRRLRYLGTPGQISGALCELIVVPERNCHPLPDGLTLEEGVLIEPLSIALHGLRMAGEAAPQHIAVLGAGPIGLSVLLVARAAGVRMICVTDKIEERVRSARTSGAAWAGNPDREDIVGAIDRVSPGQVDAVFECCGDQSALDQAVGVLRPGGRLLIIGIPAADRVSFDIHSLRRKELSVDNVRRQRNCIQDAIELIQTGKVDVRFMATHTFRIEDAQEAFELVSGYRDGVIRAVVHP